MARWRVTGSVKGKNGTILGLFGPSFGYRSTLEVITDLLSGSHKYFVREGPYESEVRVVKNGDQETIMTTPDVLSPNNLENLPPSRHRTRMSL